MGPRRNSHLTDFQAGLQDAGWNMPEKQPRADRMGDNLHKQALPSDNEQQLKTRPRPKAFGQLVALGFDVAVFTPAPYRRPRLGRPSKELSS